MIWARQGSVAHLAVGATHRAFALSMALILCVALPVLGEPDPGNPISLLGMELAEAFSTFGPPAEVFVQRGEQPWHDDVVFYYDRHLYLFWFQNRVWQLRVDRRYRDRFMGLRMGQVRSEVEQILGTPIARLEDSLIYQITDVGYPIRLRVVFEKTALIDAYLYRADF
jgi:hypothetical protein